MIQEHQFDPPILVGPFKDPFQQPIKLQNFLSSVYIEFEIRFSWIFEQKNAWACHLFEILDEEKRFLGLLEVVPGVSLRFIQTESIYFFENNYFEKLMIISFLFDRD